MLKQFNQTREKNNEKKFNISAGGSFRHLIVRQRRKRYGTICRQFYNPKDSNVDKKTRSAQQRVAANQIRRNHLFSDLGQSYTDFKNKLNKDYGFD